MYFPSCSSCLQGFEGHRRCTARERRRNTARQTDQNIRKERKTGGEGGEQKQDRIGEAEVATVLFLGLP